MKLHIFSVMSSHPLVSTILMKDHQRKYLWSFTNVTGVTGEAIADYILVKRKNWQFQLEFLWGQAYDKAWAMAGKSPHTLLQSNLKHSTRCASHRLNLCVVKCCSIREISNMMQSADKVSQQFFSNSPQRQLALENWIANLSKHERCKRWRCVTHAGSSGMKLLKVS